MTYPKTAASVLGLGVVSVGGRYSDFQSYVSDSRWISPKELGALDRPCEIPAGACCVYEIKYSSVSFACQQIIWVP